MGGLFGIRAWRGGLGGRLTEDGHVLAEGRGLTTVVNAGRPGPSALGCLRARHQSGS